MRTVPGQALQAARKFFREDRTTAWMLVFVLLFFALVESQKRFQQEPRPASLSASQVLAKLPEEPREMQALIDRFSKEKPLMAVLALVFFYGGAALLLLGVISLAAAAFRWLSGRRPLQFEGAVPEPAWDLWDVLRAVILFLFMAQVLVVFEGAVYAVLRVRDQNPTLRALIQTVILDGLILAAIAFLIRGRYGAPVRSLGWRFSRMWRGVAFGLWSYVTFLPVLIAALGIVMLFANLFRYAPRPEPIVELFLSERRVGILTLMSFFVALFGPLAEETFFRGFAYPALKKRLGIRWSLVLSAGVFSALHANVVGFVPILLLGLLLAYLYERTGSLVPAVAVHMAHNTAVLAFIFLIRQMMEVVV